MFCFVALGLVVVIVLAVLVVIIVGHINLTFKYCQNWVAVAVCIIGGAIKFSQNWVSNS